jgi:prolyl-tRNA synthetase
MNFQELKIETLRQNPSNARSEGFALLVRANYVTRENKRTALGNLTLKHLKALSQVESSAFLDRLGLSPIKAPDETFFALASGSVDLLHCPVCSYTSRRELAKFQKQRSSSESELPLEKVFTPNCNTIESLAQFLDIPKQKTAKALMFTRISDGRFIFVAIRGDRQLSEAKLKKVAGDLRPAPQEALEQAGAVGGYASPVGLKNATVIVDDLIPLSPNLVIGANESGYHLKNSNFGREFTADIVADIVLTRADDPCPNCGSDLVSVAAELLADGTGYHFENILLGLAEVYHDDQGLMFSVGVSAFDVYLMDIPAQESDPGTKAEEIYSNLQTAGIAVLFDHRNVRAGIKFKDADLIGCPIRITVGEKNLKDGMVELKSRKSTRTQLVAIPSLLASTQSLIETLK